MIKFKKIGNRKKYRNFSKNQYLKEISASLPCGFSEKRKFVNKLSDSIDDIYGLCDYDCNDLRNYFGDSREIVASYLENIDSMAVINRVKLQKRILEAVFAAVLLIIIIFAVFQISGLNSISAFNQGKNLTVLSGKTVSEGYVPKYSDNDINLGIASQDDPFVGKVESTETEYLDDGDYIVTEIASYDDNASIKSSTKVSAFYDENGKMLFSISVDGNFSYDGKESVATYSYGSAEFIDSSIKLVDQKAYCDSGTATAVLTISYHGDIITKTVTISCDKNGKIS